MVSNSIKQRILVKPIWLSWHASIISFAHITEEVIEAGRYPVAPQFCFDVDQSDPTLLISKCELNCKNKSSQRNYNVMFLFHWLCKRHIGPSSLRGTECSSLSSLLFSLHHPPWSWRVWGQTQCCEMTKKGRSICWILMIGFKVKQYRRVLIFLRLPWNRVEFTLS